MRRRVGSAIRAKLSIRDLPDSLYKCQGTFRAEELRPNTVATKMVCRSGTLADTSTVAVAETPSGLTIPFRVRFPLAALNAPFD